MRPVRFVALSEDNQSLILTDEVGRMLFLPLDESLLSAVRHEHGAPGRLAFEVEASLTPRDIQARIRAGDAVAEVARLANVPVEKVLRFAGPVLQERAAIVDFAHRNCSTNASSANAPGENFGELARLRLVEHGVEPESVVWDSYRRDNGSWRICAQWQSGRATARALWDLDKPRMRVKPIDDMAHFLCDPPLKDDDDSVAHAGATRRDVVDGHVRGRPHVAASRSFGDDAQDSEADVTDGPVVPALSMLRRSRNGADGAGSDERETARQPGARVDAPRRAEHVTGRRDRVPDSDREPVVARARAASGRSVVSDGRGAAAALGLDPIRPTKPRNTDLPSWDDILFGTDRE